MKRGQIQMKNNTLISGINLLMSAKFAQKKQVRNRTQMRIPMLEN